MSGAAHPAGSRAGLRRQRRRAGARRRRAAGRPGRRGRAGHPGADARARRRRHELAGLPARVRRARRHRSRWPTGSPGSAAADGGGLVALLRSDYADLEVERHVDHVVVEHGTLPNDELYLDLVPHSTNGGAVDHAALLARAAADRSAPTPTGGSSCSGSVTPSPAATSTPPCTTRCGCARRSDAPSSEGDRDDLDDRCPCPTAARPGRAGRPARRRPPAGVGVLHQPGRLRPRRRGRLRAAPGCSSPPRPRCASPATTSPSTSGRTRVIVVRDDDEVVRALHNVCRHRGARILDRARRLGRQHRLRLPPVDLRAPTARCCTPATSPPASTRAASASSPCTSAWSPGWCSSAWPTSRPPTSTTWSPPRRRTCCRTSCTAPRSPRRSTWSRRPTGSW